MRFQTLVGLWLAISIAPPAAAEDNAAKLIAEGNAWSVTEQKSPLDDSPGVTAILLDPQSNNALAIRCREGETFMGVISEKYVGSSDVAIQYRLNKAEPSGKLGKPFITSTGKAVSFGLLGIALFSALHDDDTLFVRIYSSAGHIVDSTFSLNRVEAVREKVLSACPIKPSKPNLNAK